MGIAASTSHHLWIGCTPSNGRQLLHVVAEGKIAQVKEVRRSGLHCRQVPASSALAKLCPLAHERTPVLQILEDDPQLASYIKPLVGISALHAAAGESVAGRAGG